MIWIIYNLLFVVVYIVLIPRFLARMWRRGGYRRHFLQRIGNYSPDILARLQDASPIWIHAVSVGEIYVALKFMGEIRARRPDTRFVISTTTSTGHAVAQDRVVAPDVLVYFPVDFPWVVRRVLNIVRPSALILIECEIWPNLIRACRHRDIPVLLVNGRISERSYRGYRKLRFMTRRTLPMIDACFVQSNGDRDRLLNLGAPAERLTVVSSAKYEVAERDRNGEERARTALKSAGIDSCHRVLLGGSTWEGEEAILLDMYARLKREMPKLVLVLAPRHVERSEDVLEEIKRRSLSVIRRRQIQNGNSVAEAAPDVFLLDTTGELKNFYACADIIFVGKSLTMHGGQNIIEPALYAKPILVGPYMENFPTVMEDFRSVGAIFQVPDAIELEKTIRDLLVNPSRAEETGERAAQLIRDKAGAVCQTVDAVAPLLKLS